MSFSSTNAQLKIYGSTSVSEIVIDNGIASIGRAPDNTVVLTDMSVSRHHAEIRLEGDRYVIVDLGSTIGTLLNADTIPPKTPQPLANNDTIQIGDAKLTFCFSSLAVAPTQAAAPALSEETVVDNTIGQSSGTVLSFTLELRGKDLITIGRDASNNTVINHPSVSRNHAQIARKNGSFVLTDLSSTNGTFVNGKVITGDRTLTVGDNIRIGPCRFTLNIDETLVQVNEEGNLRLDALGLNKQVSKEVNLLNDISLSIQAREFVVVAGVSGGGKSTLLDALNGFRPATGGHVLVNGVDLYKNYNAYRTEIGYVPQKDIVHTELTVTQALDYAAQLRMPADTTLAERQKRVDEVLQDLGLSHRRDVPIKALSGGQLKRVSIGVELLTKPSLFFLDEATSGLDPGTEADIMNLLRNLADQGRTVILITHATDNVMLCDLVVFLGAGGRIAYFGPPQEALQYFGVERFNQIYHKVERERSPQDWQQDYLNSSQYQRFVVQRQKTLTNVQAETNGNRRSQQVPGATIKRVSAWRQFLILSNRNWSILMRDRASLILMLAIAPILGILDWFTWNRYMFDDTKGDFGQVITMLFVTALVAVMVGSIATMRDIVKEADIYRRERTIGLQILPYILSKVCIASVFALYQAAIFLLFKLIAVQIPGDFSVYGSLYITLVLATMAGMVMGLLVSAISPNQNIAPLLTIIFLVPQITFGGGMLPINTLGLPGLIINHLTLTKWPFESFVTITGVGRDVAEDPCWQLDEDEREALTDAQKQDCICLGTSLFNQCSFPGILAKYNPAVDQPEPVRPESPGDPPQQPTRPDNQSFQAQLDYEDEMDQYQADMEAYQDRVNEYQTAIQQWQDEYGEWRGKYEGALGEAEGTIKRFFQDYGSMFNVNVGKYWGILIGLIMVMFGLLLVVQKRKDVI
ncbi:MAG: FHA domain-containing protein [Arthrospira sp. PLM2.Bin9]|nr:FHA domain-containing protein [Arthrospira sp. PLM2.Bin9]TVU52634.1 MAG: FHA domain-containing protein [Arthrospira sp. PLM2.Bin9]